MRDAPLECSVLFLTHSGSGVSEFERVGIGEAPNTDIVSHYVEPLERAVDRVDTFDLGREYALHGCSEANRRLVDEVRRCRPDYVLWHAMMYELAPEAVCEIRASGTRFIGWFSDDEFRFDDFSRWWAPLMDWCLTTDSSVLWAYAALGTPALRMMWGSNPEVFCRLNTEYACDVSFVGRNFGPRGQWVRSLQAAGLRVETYGRGWPAGYVSEDRLVGLYSGSRVNLCFVAADIQGEQRSVLKGRIFDVCMSGGFLLCEEVPGIEEFFEPGKEVVLFRNLEHATDLIGFYLAHEEERRAIAHAGWVRAHRCHTQERRFRDAFGEIASRAHSEEPRDVTSGTRIAGRTWSESARRVRAQWHLHWAQGLLRAGWPEPRVQEELLLTLADDPDSRRARRLMTLLGVGIPRGVLLAKGLVDAGEVKRRTRQEAKKLPAARVAVTRVRQRRVARKERQDSRRLASEALAAPPDFVDQLFDGALEFTRSMKLGHLGVAAYRYSPKSREPLLYASVYAVLLRHLLGDLEGLAPCDQSDWISSINSFQCDDGLYRDPLLASSLAEREDWWGWRHLTAHIVTALECLGGRPWREFACLQDLLAPGAARAWVASLPWDRQPDYASNAVMNRTVLLQFERDRCGNGQAGTALEEMLDHLERRQDSDSGLWGLTPSNGRAGLSIAVQTTYHILNAYFYDGRPIPHADRLMGSILRLQNDLGGFAPWPNSSACEDIDAIDPLARLSVTRGLQDGVRDALVRAVLCSWANRTPSGGLVFRRGETFAYGNALMTTEADEPSMFATWFRTLAVAYAVTALNRPRESVQRLRWLRCPGYQFWSRTA